jgi:hypothetical protein
MKTFLSTFAIFLVIGLSQPEQNDYHKKATPLIASGQYYDEGSRDYSPSTLENPSRNSDGDTGGPKKKPNGT